MSKVKKRKVVKRDPRALEKRRLLEGRKDFLLNSLYIHGTMVGHVGTEAENLKYQYTEGDMVATLKRKNDWSTMFFLFIKDSTGEYYETLVADVLRAKTGSEAGIIYFQQLKDFMDTVESDNVVSYGYASIPSAYVDWDIAKDVAINRFMLKHPWDEVAVTAAALDRHVNDNILVDVKTEDLTEDELAVIDTVD